MLADPTADEQKFLAAIPYQANEAVLHTDRSVMPRRKSAWACWNYHLGQGGSDRAALTYDMNRLQSLKCRERFFVSLNVTERIDPDRILGVYSYDHPVFTRDAVVAHREWAEVSGSERIHFAGAWLGNGFHEDGARSGRLAAEQLIAHAGDEQSLAAAA